MLDANALQWLEQRKITCNRCGVKLCILPRQGTFTGNDCVKWCRLRDARLAVEREMLAEGKGPVRKE